MIAVTRINGTHLVVNSDLIETVEATPDTVITLTTGKKIIIAEDPDEVVRRVVAFRREIGRALPRIVDRQSGGEADRPE